MQHDSYSVGKEPCPVCRSLGRDTAGDNMVRYSDGHGYCFACGNFEPSLGFDVPRGTRKAAATYEGQLSALPPEWVERLGKLVGFDESHLLVAQPRLADDDRIGYPIFSPEGSKRGVVLRGYSGQQPKALTYAEEGEPRCSWYRSDLWSKSEWTVLVEDIPSAVRVARYVDCVALLGMPTARAMDEVMTHATNIVWWLDDDMDYGSVQYRTEYQIYFQRSICILGQKDPKNMTEDEVSQCLNAVLSPRA